MRSRLAGTFAAVVMVNATVAHSPAAAEPRGLITAPIDDSQRVTLAGNTRPEANPANDRSPVADSLPIDHILLLLNRSAEQEQALENLLEQQQDRQSPSYHHWLGAAEFGSRFGAARSDIAAVSRWLAAHGFRIDAVYPSGMAVDFSGTAGQVREAFHTELHHLDVGGTAHIANISDPQIPAALAPAVAGIASLGDFAPHPMQSAQLTFSSNCAASSVIGTCFALAPADLARIYRLDRPFRAGITGKGLRIVAVENTNVFATSDWDTFRRTFRLAKYPGTFQQIHPPPPEGRNNCDNPGLGREFDEAALDGQWASAAAPGAAIVLAACKDTTATSGVLIALQNTVNAADTPDIISNSYGECEASAGAAQNRAFALIYQQAAAEGISVFASAGDAGSEFCFVRHENNPPGTTGIGINGRASTRFNVAVGGTDFADTYTGTNALYWNSTNRPNHGSAKSYIPEIPWNSSCASTLLAQFVSGSPVTYGAQGFCNSTAGKDYVHVSGGTGGPSGCAKGKPSIPGTVSGNCAGHKKPGWQKGFLGNPDDGVRDTPDVALFAADGVWGHRYVQCDSNPALGKPCTGPVSQWAGSGGTSYASPIMAGIQALVDESAGGRQGNPNPVYYRLAAEDYARFGAAACDSSLGGGTGCVFHNVTVGDNDEPCAGGADCFRPSGTWGVVSTSASAYQPAFPAHTGWNFATGLGSVDAWNLVRRWPR